VADRTRSKAEIEADIAAARERLAGNIEGLIFQVHPKAVLHRGVDDAKTFASQEFTNAKRQVMYDTGELRLERIGLIAVALLGTFAFVKVVRSLLHR